MDSAICWNREELCRFLSRFLQGNGQRTNTQGKHTEKYPDEVPLESHLRRSCLYCGEAEDAISVGTELYHEAVCSGCRREMLRQKEQFQQLVEETIHNVEYMFALSWNKRIRIQTSSFLKPYEQDTTKKEGGKKGNSSWENSVEPRMMQFRIDDEEQLCDFRIRMNVPAGTIAAAVVHIVIQYYLRSMPAEKGLRGEWIPGLSAWYMVHYLYCMDHDRYGSYYDKNIKVYLPEADEYYQKLRMLKNPKGQWVISLDQGLRMVQENVPTQSEQVK